MFWTVSVAAKVFVAFVALLLGFGATAVVGVGEIRDLSTNLQALENGQLPLARVSAQVETLQQNRLRDLRRALEEQAQPSRNAILRIGQRYYPDVIGGAEREMRRLLLQGAFDARFVNAVLADLELIREGHDALTELTVEALGTEGPAEPSMVERSRSLEAELRGATYQLNKRISDRTDHLVRSALVEERRATWRILAMVLLACLVGLGATAMAGRAVAPMGALVRYARALSRGDYDQPMPVRRRDELGVLAEELQWMARSLKNRERELDKQATELEHAYRRVDELKRYHESIVRSLGTALVVTDRDFEVSSINPAAERAWGLDPRKMLGVRLQDHSWGQAALAAVGLDDSSTDDDCGPRVRTAQACPLGDRTVHVTVAPLQTEQGDAVGWVVAVEDVTEAARTKEALIRSERLAAIGRMSAHVTHEIRNPLSSIGLNAEMLEDLLRDRPDAHEAALLCRAIGREIDRLTELTSEYLRFARLPQPELQPVPVDAFLSNLASFVRPECSASGVTVDTTLDAARGASMWVDPDQMRQAVLNLVRNAREAMPEGGAVILRARLQAPDVVLEVEDEGSGIPCEDRDRIFDPFYSTKLTGTGLGLALTNQIVIEHGGRLEVRSAQSGGTIFSITLAHSQDARMPGIYGRAPEAASA
ncbi:MAG: ATP-binding protein [Myxococcota bacterium]